MDSTSNINPCAKLIMAATAVLRKLNESQQSTSSQFGQKHFANLRIVSCNNHSTNRSPCSESFHLPANTFPDRGELRVPMSSLSKTKRAWEEGLPSRTGTAFTPKPPRPKYYRRIDTDSRRDVTCQGSTSVYLLPSACSTNIPAACLQPAKRVHFPTELKDEENVSLRSDLNSMSQPRIGTFSYGSHVNGPMTASISAHEQCTNNGDQQHRSNYLTSDYNVTSRVGNCCSAATSRSESRCIGGTNFSNNLRRNCASAMQIRNDRKWDSRTINTGEFKTEDEKKEPDIVIEKRGKCNVNSPCDSMEVRGDMQFYKIKGFEVAFLRSLHSNETLHGSIRLDFSTRGFADPQSFASEIDDKGNIHVFGNVDGNTRRLWVYVPHCTNPDIVTIEKPSDNYYTIEIPCLFSQS